MAFTDITKYLYNGSIKLQFTKSSHRYMVSQRVNWQLPVDDPKAWGEPAFPKGVTTVIESTLEKKGLLTWPLGMAMQELFGYYDFVGDDGTRKKGFSEGKGTLIENMLGVPMVKAVGLEIALPIVDSANKAWTRRQKQGADIGSIVHEAIEHYQREEPFDLDGRYLETADLKSDHLEIRRNKMLAALDDISLARQAFDQFVNWWEKVQPEILTSEQVVYSQELHIAGTYDALLKIDGKLVLTDYKTSNASKSKDTCMPEGINYQYFVQLAMYAVILEEMTNERVDDLLVVSCRKDGGFSTCFLSELGITLDEAKLWARCVMTCYTMMERAKAALWNHAPKDAPANRTLRKNKEAPYART